MNTLEMLTQAIKDNPKDPDLRLIYADAAERAGDHDRARLIRLQVAMRKRRLAAKDFIEATCEAQEILKARGESWMPPGAPWMRAHWEMGFVKEVSCPIDVWMIHGRAIAAMHPVRNVLCDDRRPRLLQSGLPSQPGGRSVPAVWHSPDNPISGGVWASSPPHWLPVAVWVRLGGRYRGEECYCRDVADAVVKLSDALADYAHGRPVWAKPL